MRKIIFLPLHCIFLLAIDIFFFTQAVRASGKESLGPMAKINASYASAEEVHKFITELGISKVRIIILYHLVNSFSMICVCIIDRVICG